MKAKEAIDRLALEKGAKTVVIKGGAKGQFRERVVNDLEWS